MARNTINSCNTAFFNSAARVGLSVALVLGGCLDAASQGITLGMPAVEAVTYDGQKVTPHEFTGDVRNLPPALSSQAPATRPYRPLLRRPAPSKIPPIGAPSEKAAAVSGPLAPMPSPAQNFAGMSRNDTCTGGVCGGGMPPDPNGDVGPNHYIQAVNDAYAIYNKTGTLLASFTENQLWSVAPASPCNGNSQGDPVVLYDWLADRWILTHLAFASNIGPFYQCIAASKTSDPVAGGWYFYALQMDPGGAGKPPAGTLNDYPKFGIWHDCLYMSANEFNIAVDPETYLGVAYASFSRADLYSGAPLTWSLGFIMADGFFNPFTMIPSNLSGQAAASVPTGTPNYFVSESMTEYAFEVRKFTPGPNCGGGGSLSTATDVGQAFYFVPDPDNVPQPNTTNTLDNLDDRMMQKVQYRKVGAAESLWVVHSVQMPGPIVAPQWAQIDVTGGTIATTPVQQQIYQPDTTLWRWMGSLAVDSQGNMALGYSTSNGTSPNFPSIAYSGRLASDPPNTLPQTEVQLFAGLGSQTNNCDSPTAGRCYRWGDYTAMSVDPADDCTFWYTNQYYSSQANGASGNWQTRIGSFKFPSCFPADQVPTCTLAASPSTITLGESATLTATCNPAATSYAWTPAAGLVAGPANTATVTPTAVGIHQYSVTGSNANGVGNTASTSVTVNSTSCTFSLFPTSQSVPANATTATLSVTAASGCAWTASSNVDWITITSGSSGSGNGTVVYSVAANTGSRVSIGTLTVAGHTFTVTQAGIPVPTCSLTASPTSIAAGGTSTLTASCSPAATSYIWTGGTCAGTSAATCTVTPVVTTTYSVAGVNSAGTGAAATATVTTIPGPPVSGSCGLANGVLSAFAPSAGLCNSGTASAVTNDNPAQWAWTCAGSGGGANASCSAPRAIVPTCTLTASASTINLGGSATLTATCSPAAASYAWTPAPGLVAGPANTATVTPTAAGIYQYSVTGSNANGVGNTASTSVTVAAATFTSQSDCFFNWAERTYPSFFAPAGGTSTTLAQYYYRFYLQTNAYLATSTADSHVYYLGPLSNNSILDAGALSDWLLTAGCL